MPLPAGSAGRVRRDVAHFCWGGTLALLASGIEEGRLRVVDHSGDNFLGGKDFDNALVDWVGEADDQFGLSEGRRDNPDSRSILSRLKVAL